MAVFNLPDGPKILTSSLDQTIRVWSLGSNSMEMEIKATGKIHHIEVANDMILWSVEESLLNHPDIVVGTIYYVVVSNPAQHFPVHRAADQPFTHSQLIRCFKVFVTTGFTYLISGGAEGNIRIWKQDPTTRQFGYMSLLEGHTRAVNTLLLNDTILWSGSSDKTIKIWDLGTSTCAKTMTIGNPDGIGHCDLISCMCLIPAMNGQEAYVASGDCKGEVRLWSAVNGEFVVQLDHSQFISDLMCFTDPAAGQPVLLIGLKNAGYIMRSCATMNILFNISPSMVGLSNNMACFANLGMACFATAGDEGTVAVWRIAVPIVEPQQQQQMVQQTGLVQQIQY